MVYWLFLSFIFKPMIFTAVLLILSASIAAQRVAIIGSGYGGRFALFTFNTSLNPSVLLLTSWQMPPILMQRLSSMKRMPTPLDEYLTLFLLAFVLRYNHSQSLPLI